MKRIAICISGQPRFFKECGKQLNTLISQLDSKIDIFIHAWNTTGEYSSSSWAPTVKGEGDLYNKIKKLYKPKSLFVEQQKDQLFTLQTSRLKKNTSAETFIQASMFYSIYIAGLLRREYEQKNQIKYDYVIRTRFDHFPCSIKGHFITKLKNNHVYFPDLILNKKVVCDYWMVGVPDVMEEVENCYFTMFRKNFLNRLKICGEEIITDHLKRSNITMVPLISKGGLMRDKNFSDKRFGQWN